MDSISVRNIVVTIDGPAGAGKSTVSRNLAKRLGFAHLNSGSLFRAIGVQANKQNISLEDIDAVAELAETLSFSFDDQGSLYVESPDILRRDVSAEISTAESGGFASKVAVIPRVREVCLKIQRTIASKNSVVVEGRDAGSIVFPDAEIKFYLVAEIEERARRRFAELNELGLNKVSLEEVKAGLEERDYRDSTRDIAPQVQAEGAIRVDTTNMSIEEVVDELYNEVKKISPN